MTDENSTLKLVAGVVVILLVISGVALYIWFAISANKAIDIHAENEHKQWLMDKKRCEDKGGIAFQSWWDGSISDCKFPPKETSR
jgi:hypothetical protein